MPSPNSLDLLYVALFAVVLPAWDYISFWPKFLREVQTEPATARMRLWKQSIFYAWPLVALGAALWVYAGRSWTTFGFSPPAGWRLWTSIGLVLLLVAYHVYAAAALASSSAARESVRGQFGALAAVLPQTRREMCWFAGVSATAGFCEEFLFRGYFIWVLAAWLGWWGAAALSLLLFAGWHAYQGWRGVLRTGIVGGLFTLTVAVFDSLWPAIALHALLDLGQGTIAWLALRDAPSQELVSAEG